MVLLAKGPEYMRHPRVQTPHFECAHTTRSRILADLIEGIKRSYALWKVLFAAGHIFEQTPLDEEMEILDDLHTHLQTTHIERLLATTMVMCPSCASKQKPPSSISGKKASDENEEHPESPLTDEEDDEECPGSPSMDGSKSPGLPEIYPTQRVPKKLHERHKEIKGAHCRPFRKPIAVRQLIPLEPKAFEILPRSRFRDFNDYFLGPSLEDLQMFSREGRLDSQPQDWYAQPTVRSSWELFRDWGYRLEPEFALMFASQKPQKEVEHLLPVPDDEEPPSDEEVEPGVEVMGMEEMLSSARLEGSKASMELFIKGQTLDGNLVRFYPIRDSCDVPLGNFVLSYDIDSINVMAHRLKVLGDVEIEVLPYSGQRPPSPKSNHTYVKLLMPQSEEDLQSGRRLEWFSTRHSVATIPHTHFGKIGYFKISIHFPRMKHKDPITNWTVTLNPWEVQSLFLTEVLYPAIIAGENPSTLPYKDYMLDEWKWKASNNTRFSGASRTVT